MHDILWLLLTSLLTGWMMFRTRKEEHFSGKKQVQEMVRVHLGLRDVPKPDDCADALAAAITYALMSRMP